MNGLFQNARKFLLWFVVCASFGALFFLKFDTTIARVVYPYTRNLGTVSSGLGGMVLVSAEAVVVMVLWCIYAIRGYLPLLGKAVALACISSICAYTFNSLVLKIFFGVPTPAEVVGGVRHAFHFLQGTPKSSFPSGHMALAGAFAGVLMQVYGKSRGPLSALLVIAAGLLVLGDWHFVSDVIGGTFVGISTGVIAGKICLARKRDIA
ncbi:MAG: phosphatase PAP2 family protein [Rhizomicrobium sp.]